VTGRWLDTDGATRLLDFVTIPGTPLEETVAHLAALAARLDELVAPLVPAVAS
jgi:hypothetical protein